VYFAKDVLQPGFVRNPLSLPRSKDILTAIKCIAPRLALVFEHAPAEMNSPVISKFDKLLSDSKPLPLRYWLYILIVSLGFGYVLYAFLLVSPPPSQAFFLYNSPRISEMADSKTSEGLNVIMLGDSRLRYSTYDDEEMGNALSPTAKQPVNVVRIVNNWAVFNDFSLLTSQILELKPELVVIQKELISKSRSDFATKILARKYWMWRLFGSGIWDPGQLNQKDLQHEMRCSALRGNETVEQRKQRVFKWYDFEGKGVSKTNLERFLEQAISKNIPVVFVSIPITKRGSEGLPSAPEIPAYDVQSPTDPVLDSHYCDIVHMNPEGRKRYTHWLSEVIVSNLLKGDSNVQ